LRVSVLQESFAIQTTYEAVSISMELHTTYQWKVKKNKNSWLKMFLYGSKHYKTKK